MADLLVYPLKSGREVRVQDAAVLPWGLADDRRWMVVDAGGELVSARTDPGLLHVAATVDMGRLRLAATGHPPIIVEPPTGPPVPLRMFGHPVLGAPAAEPAHDWVCRVAGRAGLRLVWSADPRSRRPNPAYSLEGDSVSFADGYPLLLTTTASLARLNEWLVGDSLERGEPAPEPLPMDRFRPNVVVAGSEPFAEDGWERVRIGDVSFRVAHGCARCAMTTVDRADLSRSKEPIRTLARHRSWDGKTWFGQNLIPEVPHPAEGDAPAIRTGDPVEPGR